MSSSACLTHQHFRHVGLQSHPLSVSNWVKTEGSQLTHVQPAPEAVNAQCHALMVAVHGQRQTCAEVAVFGTVRITSSNAWNANALHTATCACSYRIALAFHGEKTPVADPMGDAIEASYQWASKHWKA